MSAGMMAIIGVGVALLVAQLSVAGLLVTLMIQSEKRNIQRIDRLEYQMNRRFDQMQGEMNRRFDQMQGEMNRQFDQTQGEMNRRFDAQDERIRALEQGQARIDERIRGLERGQAQLSNELSGLKDLITHSSRSE